MGTSLDKLFNDMPTDQVDALQIAINHLMEDLDYYTKLTEVARKRGDKDLLRLGYREEILVNLLPHFLELYRYLMEKMFGNVGLRYDVSAQELIAAIPESELNYLDEIIMPWIDKWFNSYRVDKYPSLSDPEVLKLYPRLVRVPVLTIVIPLSDPEYNKINDHLLGVQRGVKTFVISTGDKDD